MAGLGGADLDQTGVTAGGLVIRADGQFPGVAPGCGSICRGRGRAGGGDGQQRLGAHRQDGVPAEGGPQPDLVLVKPGLPFSLLVAFFHRPSLPDGID